LDLEVREAKLKGDNLRSEKNKLSGEIPSDIGSLTKLKYLDISKNQLSEKIPTTIENLVELENLYLNENQLTGTIPSGIGKLTKLETLWLSNNTLSGEIPTKEIEKLENLTNIHLENNKDLTGQAPKIKTEGKQDKISCNFSNTSLCINKQEVLEICTYPDGSTECSSVTDDDKNSESKETTEMDITSNPVDCERAIGNQSNTVIDIPAETQYTDNKKRSAKKERKHVNFFKQFLIPRVYITAVISFIVILAINFINGIILSNTLNVETNSNEEAIDEVTKINPVFVTIYVCIIGPIIEELIFRQLIFWFINKFSKILAYLVSSFLFAFAHFSFSFSTLIAEIYYLPIYFIMGALLAYTYDYDGSPPSYTLSTTDGINLYEVLNDSYTYYKSSFLNTENFLLSILIPLISNFNCLSFPNLGFSTFETTILFLSLRIIFILF